jgi:hypothetical protein
MASLKEAYYEACTSHKLKPNFFILKRLTKYPDRLSLQSCALDANDLKVLRTLETRCKGVNFSQNYYIKEVDLLPWNFSSLVCVSLDHLGLTDVFGVKLFTSLGALQQLSVKSNKFTSKSWSLLAHNLPNCLLVALNLSNNRLGDASCVTILSSLSRNSKLEQLWLDSNNLSAKTAQNLMSLVRSYNTTLRLVSLKLNPIPALQLRSLEVQIKANQDLPLVSLVDDDCVSFRKTDPRKSSPFLEPDFDDRPSERSFQSVRQMSTASQRRSQSITEHASFNRREIEPFHLSLESITSAQITIDDLNTPENQDYSAQDWRNFASPNPATVTLFGTPVQLVSPPQQGQSPEGLSVPLLAATPPSKSLQDLAGSYSSVKEYILNTTEKLARFSPEGSHRDLVRQLKFGDSDDTVSQESLKTLVHEGHKALKLALSSIESLEHFLLEKGYSLSKA